jgi:hypothetical protein
LIKDEGADGLPIVLTSFVMAITAIVIIAALQGTFTGRHGLLKLVAPTLALGTDL